MSCHPFLLFLTACLRFLLGRGPWPRLHPSRAIARVMSDLRHGRPVPAARLTQITAPPLRCYFEARLTKVTARTVENECSRLRRHLRLAGLPALDRSAFPDLARSGRSGGKRWKTVRRPSAPGAADASQAGASA